MLYFLVTFLFAISVFQISQVKGGLMYVGTEANNLYLCHFDEFSGAVTLFSSTTAQFPSCIFKVNSLLPPTSIFPPYSPILPYPLYIIHPSSKPKDDMGDKINPPFFGHFLLSFLYPFMFTFVLFFDS